MTEHRHGDGPLHWGTEDGDVILEIYPRRGPMDSTSAVRIGVIVPDVDANVEAVLRRFPDTNVVAHPNPSPWGRRAVLDDPEGHRVELTAAR